MGVRVRVSEWYSRQGVILTVVVGRSWRNNVVGIRFVMVDEFLLETLFGLVGGGGN